MAIDRRDERRRADVVRLVVDQIVHTPESRVTIKNLKDLLNVPDDAAKRIIDNLVKAGLMYEVSPGVWERMVKIPSSQHAARLRRDG
jgi:predicted transcriptional regulator